MDFSPLIESLQSNVGAVLPNLIGALAILVIGWFVALLVRAGVRRLLGLFQLNERIASGAGEGFNAESGIATGMFRPRM